MQLVLRYLSRHAWFPFLIPFFFVLHGFVENFGFISIRGALLLAGIYCLGSLIVFLLLLLFYRNKARASIMNAYIMLVYLFFGAYHDFLLNHTPALGKYSILLTLLLAVFLFLLFMLRKPATFYRPILLLNLVFLVFVCIDLVSAAASFVHPPANKLSIQPPRYTNPPAQAEKPDIYFLIFDEYASSRSLQQHYGYHNTLDAWLEARDFRVQTKSYSNYHFTPASIASILNMSYLEGLQSGDSISTRDFNYCLTLIKNNELVKFLSGQGYDIKNFSTFDLAGHPAPSAETLLPIKTRLITSNTLLSRMERDMVWASFKNIPAKWLYDPIQDTRQMNGKVLGLLNNQSLKKEAHPVFVYGHVYMPHGPFLYDSAGKMKNRDRVRKEGLHTPSAYLEYLAYTNTEIMKLITAIRQNTQDKAAIILMGDHGFRRCGTRYLLENYQNLNAVYLPGRDYHLFYDSVSGVNQFKIVLNSLFQQAIPLQKDSTVFLTAIQ